MKVGRRGFLGMLGFGTLAPFFGKGKDATRLFVSHVIPDKEIIPGVAKWYNSFCEGCMANCGTRVRTREGIAVKIEGNPAHPIGKGGLCPRGQAEIFDLYHPDRIKTPMIKSDNGSFVPVAWEDALSRLNGHFAGKKEKGTLAKTAFLSRGFTGSRKAFIEEWMKEIGSDALAFFEPDEYGAERKANMVSFGVEEIPYYAIEDSKYLVSFGADFLETYLSPVSYAGQFGSRRGSNGQDIAPFIHFDSRLSLTAANADKRIWIKPGDEALIALAMANVIVNESPSPYSSPARGEGWIREYVKNYSPDYAAEKTGVPADLIKETAAEFMRHSPSLALAGGSLLAHENKVSSLIAVNLLNYVAGNINKTVRFDRCENREGFISAQAVSDFFKRIRDEKIETLVLYETNPLYWFKNMAGLLDGVNAFIIAFSDVLNETAVYADIVLPVLHPLESWRDSEPRKGIFNISRPVMKPPDDGKDPFVILSQLLNDKESAESMEDFIKERWEDIREKYFEDIAEEKFFQDSVNAGFVEIPVEAKEVSFNTGALVKNGESPDSIAGTGTFFTPPKADVNEPVPNRDSPKTGTVPSETVQIFLMPYLSNRFYDGRGANNPWLNELPDPVTTIVWDTWAEISPETAHRLGLSKGDVVKISSGDSSIDAPVYVQASMSDGCMAIPIGQGHWEGGRYAKGKGVNPLLLAADAFNEAGGLILIRTDISVSKKGERVTLAKIQASDSQEGRRIYRSVSLEEPEIIKGDENHDSVSFYPERPFPGYRWGMVVDLNRCIGCGACVLGCVFENNVQFVGRHLCLKGRHMTWLRIERYVEEEKKGVSIGFLPMLCQHCANAPCEPVCPVYATVQSDEGLNTQVYSRCVGTRYCSNNCPYKVRRFNWFTYSVPEEFKKQRNPDVPARTKGIMEKCTFCIQRIREAKDHAKDEKRKVIDGELRTACSESCPTGAIIFGDLNDKESRVSRLAQSKDAYRVFEGLNTKPSVYYLKKEHPEMSLRGM